MKARVTHSPTEQADVHVVSGPHFAKNEWLGHPRTILLDRAYWHEGMEPGIKSMPWVSLGWLRPDGGRSFRAGTGRKGPEPKPLRNLERSIFLADYDGPIDQADRIRLHPAKERHTDSLTDALAGFGVAIGYQTTALVTAALEGLRVDCRDSRNIVSEPNWLQLLPYADWHWSEMAEAWEHLKHGM